MSDFINEDSQNLDNSTENEANAPEILRNEDCVCEEEALPSPKNSLWKNLLDYVETIVLAVCLVISIFAFTGFRICTVSGPSMEKTLYHGDRLIISDMLYTPERGDIVVFHQTSDDSFGFNEPIVKRIIGVSGDTVSIEYHTDSVVITVTDKSGNITVIDESAYRYVDADAVNYYKYGETTFEVAEGTVFVMGDNLNHSADSRDSRISLVDTRRILGKVVFRLSPLSDFGVVK